jgi:hypothetical protein
VPTPPLALAIDNFQSQLVKFRDIGGTFLLPPAEAAVIGTPTPEAPARISVFLIEAFDPEKGTLIHPEMGATYLFDGVVVGGPEDGAFTGTYESGFDMPFPAGSVAASIECAATYADLAAWVEDNAAALAAHDQAIDVLNANDVQQASDIRSNSLDVADLYDQLGAKAPIASPPFTGTPTAPTPAPGTNNGQLATTAFVLANAPTGSYSPLAGSAAIVTVGTLTAGAWNATNIPVAKLGTGAPAAGTYLDGAGAWTLLPAAGGGGGTAIGGAVTGGTAGSVLFVGGGPVLAQATGFTFSGGALTQVSIPIGASGNNAIIRASANGRGMEFVAGGGSNEIACTGMFRCDGGFLTSTTGNGVSLQPNWLGDANQAQGFSFPGDGSNGSYVEINASAPTTNLRTLVAQFYGGGPNGGVRLVSVDVARPVLSVRRKTGQTAPQVVFTDSFGGQLSGIGPEGSFLPPSVADGTASNGSIYFGTDHTDTNGKPKLCRKDSAGVVTVIG